jgi:hypothetical protein
MGTESNERLDGLKDRERTRHRAQKKRGWMEDLNVSTRQIKHTNTYIIKYVIRQD